MTDTPRYDNLKTTYRRWQERQHPASCELCQLIWGAQGAPTSFEDYASSYPDLEHGQKRHLTQKWNPGLTPQEVARQAGCNLPHVRAAIDNGMLESSEVEGQIYVTRTQATLWAKAGAPTGDSVKSWIRVEDAARRYGFTVEEIAAFIESGRLAARSDAAEVLVSRRQCGSLRDELGFTSEHAAARLGVEVSMLPELLDGLTWRPSGDLIPLAAIRAAAKRLEDLPDFPRTSAPVPGGWVVARQAADIAGVSLATLDRWSSNAEVSRQHLVGGWHYEVESVRDRARIYWALHSGRPGVPRWLLHEVRETKATRGPQGRTARR